MIFRDRAEAGRVLARCLTKYANQANVLVLGIPRGGVPVAYQVANELCAPLDVFVVRKLGVPGQEELAFGAIASGGVSFLDRQVIDAVGITRGQIEHVAAKEKQELARRERVYRGDRVPLHVEGRVVILVDDGIATGSSMQVAIRALRQMKPARIIVGAPVAPISTYERLRSEADEIICVQTPVSFYAIGEFYEDFSQVVDQEVTDLLRDVTLKPVRNLA